MVKTLQAALASPPNLAEELFDLGADVITTGNHVWDKRELIDYMKSVPADSHERARRILRPVKPASTVYPATASMRASSEDGPEIGTPYAVVNLMGRVFMNATNDPIQRLRKCALELVSKPK